jgi:transketolase
MRKKYEETLFHLMGENQKLLALVADSGTGKYEDIKRCYPDRYLNFGIAEANMIAAAAGLAKEGLVPVCYAIGSFVVYRAYEFIRNDICLQRRNVKIVGLGSGLKNNNYGPTHHTTEDIAIFRVLPNFTLLSPASPLEVSPLLNAAVEFDGPVYIRLGKAFEAEIHRSVPAFKIGKCTIMREGADISIIGTGSNVADAIEAADLLAVEGISAEVLNMSTLKPLDTEAILATARKTGRIVTVEEHQIAGGLGSAIAETLCLSGVQARVGMLGLNDIFCQGYGYHAVLKERHGLSVKHIANKCRQLCC